MALKHQFSHHARRALTHAAQLARDYSHPRQETGHLLVGVILAEGSIGARVMQDFDVPAPVAQVYLKRMIKPDSDALPDRVPRDPSFDTAIELADNESSWLGHHYVGTEHLLLGITRTNVGNALNLLNLLDITPEQIRRRVRHIISDGQIEFSLQGVRQNARLSELSRRVLNAAEQKAVSLDHPAVGLGHLLLALAEERRGMSSRILHTSGLDPLRLKESLARRDTIVLVSIENVLHEAVFQAEKFGSHYLGADHLLLTMTLITPGQALLNAHGVSVDRVNRLLTKHLRED